LLAHDLAGTFAAEVTEEEMMVVKLEVGNRNVAMGKKKETRSVTMAIQKNGTDAGMIAQKKSVEMEY
tara:strand:- start:11565 stop:11765 length:201 start_codon:yes stop_codon:yes gene_type:complete